MQQRFNNQKSLQKTTHNCKKYPLVCPCQLCLVNNIIDGQIFSVSEKSIRSKHHHRKLVYKENVSSILSKVLWKENNI